MTRAIRIKQRDVTDCGAAALTSIAAFHKLRLPVSRVRQLASTDKKGTNVLGLIEAAVKMGFDAKGVRGERDSLSKIPLPAIAHVIERGVLHHYVVIYKVTPKYVRVMNPADGAMHDHSHEDFMKLWTGVLLILWPGQNFEQGGTKASTVTRFWLLIAPHKSIMTQVLFGAMLYTLLGLTNSIYVQKIVDYVLIDGNRNLLNLMSVVMITLLVSQVVIGVVKSVITLRTGQAIDRQLILGYYKHLLKLPQQFFDSMRVGEIISRINDAVKIRTFVNDVSVNLAVNVFVLIFSFALMFTYYWKFALIILLVVPFYCIIYFVTSRLNKKVERNLMEKSADLESQLVESLNSVNTIKGFGLETYTNLNTEARFVALLKVIYKSGLNAILSGSSSDFFSRLFTILLLWLGAGFVLENEITAGELLSFYALIGYFTGPASSLIGMDKMVQNAVIAADRLFEIMDLEWEGNENRIKLTPDLIGDINFKNVDFRYGSRTIVFKDLQLYIRKGKVSAIVGESGSGKSTIVSVLQNLYPIQGGNVMIGNYDVRYIESQSLRRLVSSVPQKIDLFAGNVIDNIAVGDYEPDMKMIVEICSELGIMEFIEKLPNGFDTYLGENGATLSGGQKQRIAIARALYREPEILILDEATSSLDSTAEGYVQRMIEILRAKEKTVIIIAHRLSTVFRADKIIVLRNGSVAEEGDHDELMRNRSYYFTLWKEQFPMMEHSLMSEK